MWRIVLALLVACAPTVDGPVERQRTADLADGERLAAELAALPGAVSAHAILHRPIADPLSAAPPVAPATAALLVVVDDRTDRAATLRDARALLRATAPDVRAPEIVVDVGAPRAELASVGPFTVEAGSRGLLRGVLGSLFALLAALAGYVALSAARRGRRT